MLKTFMSEVRRRNVLPTIVPYVGLVWLLLQVVSVLQPMLNLHPLVSTFTAIVLFAGFPVVLYLAWYFNLSLDGLVAIPALDNDLPTPFGTGKWLVLLLITIGSGSLGYLYFKEIEQDFVKSAEGIRQVAQAASIVVLPFRDLSPDQDQGFVSDGLTEELSALLGNSSNLQVAAASSAFALADKQLTPMDVGRRLKVDTVLTGSLRVTGNRLKIRTELIDSNSGMTLWTETFAREFKDIFAIEEEISRSIVNLLEDRYLEKGQLSSSAKTASTDAYVMYLKGREQYRQQTTESMQQARKFFAQAITLDPEYAQAYVGLADSIVMLAKSANGFGHDAFFGVLDSDIAAQLAESNLEKALVRAPDLADAYAVRGIILALLADNFEDAISSFNKAITLNPSLAKAHMWKFLALDDVGQFSAAWESLQIAHQLNPISAAIQYNRGYYLLQQGQFELAQQQFSQLREDFPQSPFGWVGKASLASMRGDLSQSAQYWFEAVQMSPQSAQYRNSLIETLVAAKAVSVARDFAQGDAWKITFDLVAGNIDQVFANIEFQMAADPQNPWLLFEAAWYHLIVGDQQKGKTLLLTAYPLFSQGELFNMPFCSPGIEISWALQQDQQFTQAEKLLTRCASLLQNAKNSQIRDPFVDYLRARIHSLQGEEAQASQALIKAYANGWRQWWTGLDPLINPILSDPEIVALLARLEQDLETDKQQIIQHFQ